MEKKISEKSIIYIPERNWKTSIITFLNVPNLLMKGNCLLITIIEIDIKSLNMLILCHINLHISMLIHFFRKCIVFLPGSSQRPISSTGYILLLLIFLSFETYRLIGCQKLVASLSLVVFLCILCKLSSLFRCKLVFKGIETQMAENGRSP